MVRRVKGNNGGEVYAGSDKADGRARNGRKPGVPNKLPRVIKEMLLLAAEDIGFPCDVYEDEMRDGVKTGKRFLVSRTMTRKDGLRGYLQHLGLTDQKTFAGLLGRIIPTQINMKVDDTQPVRLMTIDDVIENMKAKGIPKQFWPQKLLEPPRPDN